MRRFTSKSHVYENFDVMGIQRRFAPYSFPKKMLLRNRPAFNSKEKFDGYSVYSYSRIGSIERALSKSLRCLIMSVVYSHKSQSQRGKDISAGKTA